MHSGYVDMTNMSSILSVLSYLLKLPMGCDIKVGMSLLKSQTKI